ncbi:MAG TPA: ABC transporter permease [Vitreimonas sp.]|jgi:ABC-2 type transport system permease protein|nr:ABC transporter permease [Vitreimonas sp.]
MLTWLSIEARKLKGTLVLLLCGVAPTLVTILVTLISLRRPGMDWHTVLTGSTGLWSFFVLPMTITALSALLAHIEHGPRAWDHLFALPISRWRLFAAKAIVLMALVGGMSLMLALELRVAGGVLQVFGPAAAPRGPFPWREAATLLGEMWAASLCMGMIQLWVALRFRSFVAPLTTGLCGTFVAVAAFNATEAMYVPWAMPVSIVGADGVHAMPALQMGVAGGLITFALMVIHLSQREA